MERHKARIYCGSPPAGGTGGRFWNWRAAQDDEEAAQLTIEGVIDSGTSWFEDGVTPKAFRAELNAHEGEAIEVTINSPGGDVFAALDILDMLQRRRGATRVRVAALCASAASIIAMGADPDELVITRTGMMMIHNPLVYAEGNAAQLREHAGVLEELTDIMVGVYMERFKGSEKELRAMLDAETYLKADEAIAWGLADRIEARERVSAACTARYAATIDEALRRAKDISGRGQREPAKKKGDRDRIDALIAAQTAYHQFVTER